VCMPDVLNAGESFWVLFCDQTQGAVISVCITTLGTGISSSCVTRLGENASSGIIKELKG
jgi:hypothetical protein